MYTRFCQGYHSLKASQQLHIISYHLFGYYVFWATSLFLLNVFSAHLRICFIITKNITLYHKRFLFFMCQPLVDLRSDFYQKCPLSVK